MKNLHELEFFAIAFAIAELIARKNKKGYGKEFDIWND